MMYRWPGIVSVCLVPLLTLCCSRSSLGVSMMYKWPGIVSVCFVPLLPHVANPLLLQELPWRLHDVQVAQDRQRLLRAVAALHVEVQGRKLAEPDHLVHPVLAVRQHGLKDVGFLDRALEVEGVEAVDPLHVVLRGRGRLLHGGVVLPAPVPAVADGLAV